jgi:hypothetical protein
VSRASPKKGGKYDSELEQLNKDFSQSQGQLLQQNVIERVRLVKRKHKQEKRKEMTHGKTSRHEGRAHRHSSHWRQRRQDSNGGSDSKRRAVKADGVNRDFKWPCDFSDEASYACDQQMRSIVRADRNNRG